MSVIRVIHPFVSRTTQCLAGMCFAVAAVSLAPAEDVVARARGYWNERAPRVGDAAPPLTFEKLLEAPAGLSDVSSLSWEKLRGKITVLDFSTSWCMGCIQSAPHVNELIRQLRDDPIVFVMVSNESEASIADFRSKFKLVAPIARDVDGSTFEDYWVNGVPQAVVIDKQGKIAAFTHPALLNATMLRELAAGKKVEFPAIARGEPQRMSWDARDTRPAGGEGVTSPAQVLIEKVSTRDMRITRSPTTGEFFAGGTEVQTLVLMAYDANRADVTFDLPSPEGLYQVRCVPADGKLETGLAPLRAALESKFGFLVERTRKQGDVFLLRRAAGAAPPPASAALQLEGRAAPGSFALKGVTCADLAKRLRIWSSRPVLDRTGLADRYDFELKWDVQGKRDALNAALAKVGLELVEGQGEFETLRIRSVATAGPAPQTESTGAANRIPVAPQPTPTKPGATDAIVQSLARVPLEQKLAARTIVGNAVLISGDAAVAKDAAVVIKQALARFAEHFGDMTTPGVAVDSATLSAGDLAALRAAGAAWVLSWPVAMILGSSPQADKPAFEARKNEALDGLMHELGHVWFRATVWPSGDATTRPVGQHYGSDAPDWLDEVSAILIEGDAVTTSRRSSARDMEFPPLREFFAQTHPGVADGAAALRGAADQIAEIRKQGGSGAVKLTLAPNDAKTMAVFYSQSRLFIDFMTELSGDPQIFAKVARHLSGGGSFDSWLATGPPAGKVPSSIDVLAERWRSWCQGRVKLAR